MRKLWLCATVLAATCTSLSSPLADPAAAASNRDKVVITTAVRDGILWIEVAVPKLSADHVTVDIGAPRAHGKGRVLFQRCRFPYAGAGTYRCGVDVSSFSKSERRTGTLLVAAFIDGRFAARKELKL